MMPLYPERTLHLTGTEFAELDAIITKYRTIPGSGINNDALCAKAICDRFGTKPYTSYKVVVVKSKETMLHRPTNKLIRVHRCLTCSKCGRGCAMCQRCSCYGRVLRNPLPVPNTTSVVSPQREEQ